MDSRAQTALVWGLTSITIVLFTYSIYYFKFGKPKKVPQIKIDKESRAAGRDTRPPALRNSNDNIRGSRGGYEPPVFELTIDSIKGEIQKTRNKALEQLPICVDVPRLAKNFVIYDKNERVVFNGATFEDLQHQADPQAARTQLIYAVLSNLYRGFEKDEEKFKIFSEKYEEKVSSIEGGDVSVHLKEFFADQLPNGSLVTSLLKICNQSILAAVVVRMKVSIGEKFPYKDQRGRWFIHVHLPFPISSSKNDGDDDNNSDNKDGNVNNNNNNINNDDNNDNDNDDFNNNDNDNDGNGEKKVSNKLIRVIHRKEEVSWNDGSCDPFISFGFTWELRMTLDAEVNEMKDVEIALVDFQLTEPTSVDNLKALYNCILSCPFVRIESEFFDKFK